MKNASVTGLEPSAGVLNNGVSMQQQPIDYKPFHGGKFGEAMKQAEQLKNIKNRSVKHWQESNIIKTLLSGLRGK